MLEPEDQAALELRESPEWREVREAPAAQVMPAEFLETIAFLET